MKLFQRTYAKPVFAEQYKIRQKSSTEYTAIGVYQEMRRAFTLGSLAVVITLAAPLLAFADDSSPRLVVRTADGQATYRVGERIPLELNFTGPDNKRFEINIASYDRSGRMECEEFNVAPTTGWADPLYTYFGSRNGYMGGGVTGFAPLSEKPTAINLNLNEWVRFDQPGVFTIVVTSRRVADVATGRGGPFGSQATSLTSNSIQLRIIPATKAWQRAKLAAIVAELEANPKPPGIEPDSLKAAVADLRFLGTAGAAQVMAQHLRDDNPTQMYQCAFGLIGLRENLHPAALAAMNHLIDDPNFPVSGWFLNTMSVLQLSDAVPAVEREERERHMQGDWALALQTLPAKEGTARAATAQTLLSSRPKQMTLQQKTELAGILASSLKDLPRDKQVAELSYDWDVLRSADLLPELQQLARTPMKSPGNNESNAYTTRELKSIALQRWFELDPVSAHEDALRQIGSPDPSLTANSLAFLPREKLPQFEGLWADQFVAADDFQRETLFASLMARFGVGSAVARVREKANAKVGEWACAPQGAALAYLVEFDPESARPLVERAVKERGEGKTGCNQSVFQDIALYAMDPILTEVALETLDDPDPQVTMDALIYLMSYGDKSAEQPVWNRYVDWSERWRGHADVLGSREAGSNGNWQEIGLGENLARTLIASQGWLATPDLIARVLGRCVGEQMCTQLKQIADRAKAMPYFVSAWRSGENQNYEIAQYSAKSLELLDAKIAQFPPGTQFSLTTTSPQNQDQMQLEDQVSALFEKNGMILLRQQTAELR
jgi:hypothetical protein